MVPRVIWMLIKAFRVTLKWVCKLVVPRWFQKQKLDVTKGYIVPGCCFCRLKFSSQVALELLKARKKIDFFGIKPQR